ncbi:MAG: hypothetical protein ACKO4T_09990 [Planctomycetaceae bacterium]
MSAGVDGVDVLERLADVAVPPMPTQRSFTAGVRRKLNPRLLVVHVIEFALGATGWAMVHMAVVLLAALQYSVTGTWPGGREREENRGDAR